jgi:hypothetical protein
MPALHLAQMPCTAEVHALRYHPEQGWLPSGFRAGDGSCDPTYADRQWTDNPEFRLQLRVDACSCLNLRATLIWLGGSDLRRRSPAGCAREENDKPNSPNASLRHDAQQSEKKCAKAVNEHLTSSMSCKQKWRSLCACKGCDTFDCQLHAFVRRRRDDVNELKYVHV